MSNSNKRGLVKKQTLTESELKEIEQLAQICNHDEGLRMRLSWEMLRKRRGKEINDFLYYEDTHLGANSATFHSMNRAEITNTLVGYLAMDSYGRTEKELTGMVHPNYRRRGIFRALLDAAKEESRRRGIQRLLLVCERTSDSGQAFIRSIGAYSNHSEHEMVLGAFQGRRRGPESLGALVWESNDFPSGASDAQLRLRRASADDLEAIVSVHSASFGDEKEQVRHYTIQGLQEPKSQFYLGVLGEKPIGCLRLDEIDDEIGIYGFGVHPEYQGRGYGRRMLEGVIRRIQKQSPKGIMLDVDIDNTNAVKLYRGCGFQIRTTYDYYGLDLR